MIEDRKYREAVRRMPCVISGMQDHRRVDPAHIRLGTDGGTGLKPSDCYILPLCNTIHSEQHRAGERAFWAEVIADCGLLRHEMLRAYAAMRYLQWLLDAQSPVEVCEAVRERFG